MKTQRKPYEFTDRKATFQESETFIILDSAKNKQDDCFNSDKKDWEQFFNLKSK